MTDTTTRNMDLYDRVTSVIFPFSGLTKVDPEILRKAAARGTAVHDYCNCLIAELPCDTIDDTYMGYIDSFNLWAEGKKFLLHPGRWFDDELMITGECDGIYEMDGEFILFDLKTPAKQGSTWNLQGAAYRHLAHKNNLKIDHVEFVRLQRNGKKPTVYGYGDSFDEFMMLLTVYRKYFKNNMTELHDF